MVDFNNLIDLQVELFLFMMLGYVLNKLHLIDAKARKSITDLVIFIVLPCNIIYSFMIKMSVEIIESGIIIFFVSVFIQILCELLSHILYPHVSEQQNKVLKYATICSNAGFMGSPLVQGLYGLQGLLFASIYLIPQRVIMWSSGIACFSSAKGKDVIKKVLTHPCIIAVLIGIFIMLLQIELPTYMTKTIASVSNCTMFLSMLVIGGVLAEISFKSVLNKLVIYFSFIRLLLIPCIVLLGCYLLKLPMLVCAVACVLAGMPAGTTTVILAEKYDGDSALAVQLIFLSTALSLISVPFLCVMIEFLM